MSTNVFVCLFLSRLVLSELLPDLMDPRQRVRDNAILLLDRLALMFGLTTSQLLLEPLADSALEGLRYSPISTSSSSPVELDPLRLLPGAVPSQSDIQATILGQIILRISGTFELSPPSHRHSAAFDALSWILSLTRSPVPLSSLFLTR